MDTGLWAEESTWRVHSDLRVGLRRVHLRSPKTASPNSGWGGGGGHKVTENRSVFSETQWNTLDTELGTIMSQDVTLLWKDSIKFQRLETPEDST